MNDSNQKCVKIQEIILICKTLDESENAEKVSIIQSKEKLSYLFKTESG